MPVIHSELYHYKNRSFKFNLLYDRNKGCVLKIFEGKTPVHGIAVSISDAEISNIIAIKSAAEPLGGILASAENWISQHY